MASGKSEYLERALLDHVCGGPDYLRPGTVYVALSTALFDDALTGSSIVEPVGGAYARVAVLNNATNWLVAASPGAGVAAVKKNGTAITFPTPTAAWGTIKSVYVCDAASGGNVLFGGDLVLDKVIASGDATAFVVGTLTWSED